eukprot:scaffold8523_cov18-Tisochrysis_lutea.AAC.1
MAIAVPANEGSEKAFRRQVVPGSGASIAVIEAHIKASWYSGNKIAMRVRTLQIAQSLCLDPGQCYENLRRAYSL